jgi:hypothetical protein
MTFHKQSGIQESTYPFKDEIVVILLLVKRVGGGGGFGATIASNHSIL